LPVVLADVVIYVRRPPVVERVPQPLQLAARRAPLVVVAQPKSEGLLRLAFQAHHHVRIEPIVRGARATVAATSDAATMELRRESALETNSMASINTWMKA
jgi:hypothetical protein